MATTPTWIDAFALSLKAAIGLDQDPDGGATGGKILKNTEWSDEEGLPGRRP